MEKKELIKLLDSIFVPFKFKRKGNNWVFNGDVISKIINLQKSNYSNLFYVNYGFIIQELELTTVTHIGYRLAAIEKSEQSRITNLLDLESNISDDIRLSELKTLITKKVLHKMQSINTEEDILNELKSRSHLNDIPLVVKKHFNLE